MGKLLVLLALAALIAAWWRGRSIRRAMPASEARAVLGVPADAGPDEVRAAHRRIIARVHPDTGGSAELARRANLARDLLLKELERCRNN